MNIHFRNMLNFIKQKNRRNDVCTDALFVMVFTVVCITLPCSDSEASPIPVKAPGAVIEPSIIPARTTGVAPLSIFFDATGTVAPSATGHPFHDLEYDWNFGDERSGSWSNGAQPGRSKNTASGPIAAHVFETPGTYTVTLNIRNDSGYSTATTIITVDDPDDVYAGTRTVCVGASVIPVADTDGCPAGATVIKQANFASAINTYAKTGKRVLFKRGDTYTATSGAHIAVTGPGTVGTYGTGAQPLIHTTFGDAALTFSGATTPNIRDWRVMDLNFKGGGIAGSTAIKLNGGIDQLTILRVSATQQIGSTFSASSFILDWWNNHGKPGHHIWDQLSIVDSTISNPGLVAGGNAYGVYLSGDRMYFAGNSIDLGLNDANSYLSHDARFPYLGKSIVSNNTFANAGPTQHAIKLHAPLVSPGLGGDAIGPVVELNGAGGGFTRWVIISDNKMVGHNSDWISAIGPQNGQNDERVKDVIVERNWYVGTNSQVAQIIWAADVTVRNNIWSMSTPGDSVGLQISQRGIEPPSTNVRVYNNTYFNSAATRYAPEVIRIGPTVTNITIKNNLGYSAKVSGNMISGRGASGFDASNNTSDSQLRYATPIFITTSPLSPNDFRPSANGYAKNGGTHAPVWSDFFHASRQPGKSPMGAVAGP